MCWNAWSVIYWILETHSSQLYVRRWSHKDLLSVAYDPHQGDGAPSQTEDVEGGNGRSLWNHTCIRALPILRRYPKVKSGRTWEMLQIWQHLTALNYLCLLLRQLHWNLLAIVIELNRRNRLPVPMLLILMRFNSPIIQVILKLLTKNWWKK